MPSLDGIQIYSAFIALALLGVVAFDEDRPWGFVTALIMLPVYGRIFGWW